MKKHFVRVENLTELEPGRISSEYEGIRLRCRKRLAFQERR